MISHKTFNFSDKLSAIVIDSPTESLWIAYNKNFLNRCKLQKVSVYNPRQLFFEEEIEVDKIVKMFNHGGFIYLALEDDELFGKFYSSVVPLSVSTNIVIPEGINESPVDVIADDYFIYYLVPGILEEENAKILIFDLDGEYIEIIDLLDVKNASSFIRNGDDFWVVTDTNPGQFIRVYPIDFGWEYTINY